MESPRIGSDGAAAVSGPFRGHEDCRLREFVRWSRVMLEHEREHLSRVMRGKAFLPAAEQEAVMHELTDIDWCLSHLEKRVSVPGEE